MRGVCVMLILLLLSFAASAQQVVPEDRTLERGYRLGAGDIIAVDGFQHDEISGQFPVEESGVMTFPLLGTVPVAGLSTSEVALLLERLLEKDYYVDVQLQVEVKEYRSQPVTVLGEVGRPGTFYLKGRTTLTQILAEAGGPRATAGNEVELRRGVQRTDGTETQKVMVFSTEKLLSGEEGADVVLAMGDVISVSAKKMYFITGEIARPGQYEIASGMTLMQAISHAGGLAKFASQDMEIRREVDDEMTILTFDLSMIRKGKIEDPAVKAGDMIIVRRRFF